MTICDYNVWAHARVYDHLKTLPPLLLHEPVKSVFPSLFDVLVHVYIIDTGWHAVLTGQHAADDYGTIRREIDRLLGETREDSLEGLAARQQQVCAAIAAIARSRSLTEEAVYAGVPMQLGEVMLHIANHGTYHRGNISAMLHQLGHAGVPTDYGFYLYHLRNK
ncbi:damage-inducible protein DinB [Chitinophaga lutea]|uniref:Damage-inducible protein DinB n=1 Tax=Chitinophaga lutea TaxID=2488634 RepID=A0A3N4PUD3_9BACT|nr:DinB family protein [Chitinophaga lutea]RPE12433.1 damage-inducible protein DinB [Chitinophaga lutea]